MILAINTSTKQFGLALLKKQGSVLSEYLISPGSKNFRGFMPAVHSILESTRTEIAEIKAVIVVSGPGSFTGLRVGLSAAKGMAQGLQIPVIGVSGLEVMASQLPFAERKICPIIDSRKDEIFIALFKWDYNNLIRVRDDISIKIDELRSVVSIDTVFIGNDFDKQGDFIKNLYGDAAMLAPPYLWNMRASAVGNLGLSRFFKNDFDNLRDLVPSYLRPPDIRVNPRPPL